MRYMSLFFLLLAITLTSCSHIRNTGIISDRDTEYLKARSTPPLKIPPGLSSSTIKAHYPVPEVDYPESAKRVDLLPPELATTTRSKRFWFW